MIEYWLVNAGNALVMVPLFFGSLIFCDKVIFKQIDFIKELKNGNTSVAIVLAAVFIAIAIMTRQA